MEESRPLVKRRFYKTGWGVMLLAIIALVLLLFFTMAFQVSFYYQKIKLGELAIGTGGSHFTKGRLTSPARPKEKLALSAEDDPSFGSKDSSLQIIEFADFGCAYSKEFSFTIRELMVKYPDKFNYIFRDFPLNGAGDSSFHAAQAADCAAEQEKFWPMHDKIFQNQDKLSDLDLKLYALQSGLDMAKFNSCFDNQKYKEEVEIDLADGQAAGVTGTPTFFINGVKVEGVIAKDALEKIILNAK
ncbi:MAG: thioredoxin domain-containing protein [bacterium]|nr:thioredoxin domain-containing protein [bacterium]